MIKWKYANGEVISCTEMIKVLNENYEEIQQSCQEAIDDASLIGCSVIEMKELLKEMIDSLENRY